MICDTIRNLISFSVPSVSVVQDTEFPYAVHKKMLGKTWNINYVHGLDKDSQTLLADDCVNFLSEIHNINKDDLNAKTKKQNIDLYYDEYGPRDFSELEIFLKEFFSTQDILVLAHKYDSAIKFETSDIVFCHNDFNGNNCILDENNRLTGVFDWGNCGIGERTKDFMRLFFADTNKDFFDLISHKYEVKTGVHIDENRLFQLNMMEIVNLVYWLNIQESLKPIKETDLESWIIPAVSKFI